MEILLAIIVGIVVTMIVGVAMLIWRRVLSRFGHPTLEDRIKGLESSVGHIAEYLDGLPTTDNKPLRAAFEDARALQQEGYAAQNAHKHREAIERFTRALALAENDSQRAALHNLRGNSHLSISEYGKAEADYQETLELAARISPERDAAEARATALGNLGLVYYQRGDLEKAEEHCKQALEIEREIGNRLGEAQDLGNLGNVYRRRGELERAEKHHKQALKIDREIGYRLGEAHQLGNLGRVYLERGELDKAKEHFQQAQAIFEAVGAAPGAEKARRLLELIEEHELEQRERGE